MSAICPSVNCPGVDDPLSGYSSADANSARSVGCEKITCSGTDDPLSNYSSEGISECSQDPSDFTQLLWTCHCFGDHYRAVLCAPGINGPWSWTIDGDLPPTLSSTPNFPAESQLLLNGFLDEAGFFEVRVTVRDGQGNIFVKRMQWSVIQILTLSLPETTVGVPYSVQLQAEGGSGQFAWYISGGGLAPGLILNSSGLITGTPTAASPAFVTLHVQDIICEPIPHPIGPNPPFVGPPIVNFVSPSGTNNGVATIKTRTWKGFNQFGNPPAGQFPKRYKRLDWTGQLSANGAGNVGHPGIGQHIVLGYCGGTTLDTYGNATANNRVMDGYSSCHADQFGNCQDPIPGTPITISGRCINGNAIVGTLYAQRLFAGPAAGTDWTQPNAGDNAKNAGWGFGVEGIIGTIVSATQSHLAGTFTDTGPNTFPHESGILNIDRTITLSDEYTDADAEATAVITTAPGLVAANIPRGTGMGNFGDREVSVQYSLRADRLMIGQPYVITILWRHTIGNVTFTETKSYAFTPTTSSFTVTDTIPVPAVGEVVVAFFPRIDLA